MDVQRNGDTAGLGAMAHRPLLSSSSTQTSLGRTSTPVGGVTDGGLLATFDVIFRQTLSPQPPPLASPPPPPSPPSAPPSRETNSSEGSAPERIEPQSVSASDEEDREDDAREPAEPATAAVSPQPATTDELAGETAAGSEENVEAIAAGSAAADESDSDEEAELEQATEPSAERDAPAAEAAEDAADATPSPQPADATDNEAAAVAAEQIAPPTPTAEPLSPQVEAGSQHAAAVETSVMPRATAHGAEKASDGAGEHPNAVAGPPLNAVPNSEGETSSAAVETSEPANVEGGETLTEEPQTTAEEATEATEATDVRNRDGRESRNRDEAPQHERNESSRSPAHGERRAAESASRDRAIDNLVAQMQPLESPLETPPSAPQGAQPAPLAGAAAAVAAAPTATSAAARKADGGDVSPTSGDRLSLDGSEPRRSVGSIKGDSAEGQVQNTSNADRVRLVQRVARAFQRLGPDGGRVQVMLHPAELGSVRLDLRIDGNRMDARMTAESELARSVLREHLPELRQRLADSGLVVERIEIEVDARASSEGASGEGERRGQERGEDLAWQRGPQTSPPLRRSAPAPPAAPMRPSLQPAAFGSRASLDLMA